MAKRKAKKKPKTHAHAATGPNLLNLPAEVRTMIYRLLLVADKTLGGDTVKEFRGTVWAKFGDYHLQPAILGVCRQMYREASPILNGENTFGIRIYGEVDFAHPSYQLSEAKTELMNFELDLEKGSFRNCNASFNKFERLEISIDCAYLAAVRLHISTLCSLVLRTMPAVQHLTLHLMELLCDFKESTVEPFGMFRNLRTLRCCGIPPWYKGAEGLRELMRGNTPSENLREMYRLLQRCVYDLNGDRLALQKALKAVEEWDVKRFKDIRSAILSDIQRRMDRALRHVFDHDAKSEEATIKANDDRESAEDDHDSTVEEV